MISGAWAKRRAPKAALLALALLVTATAAQAGTLRTVDRHWPAGTAKSVKIRFPVGELAVVASDGTEIVAHVRVQGDDDAALDDARDVKLVLERSGKKVELRVEGWHLSLGDRHTVLVGRVEVPRSLALEVDMRVGELAVSGFERAADIDLGIGEARIDCDPARIGRIDAQVTIGEGNLVENGRTHQWAGIFAGGYRWDGVAGGPQVRLRLGIGEATINLEAPKLYSSEVPK